MVNVEIVVILPGANKYEIFFGGDDLHNYSIFKPEQLLLNVVLLNLILSVSTSFEDIVLSIIGQNDGFKIF